MDAMDLSKIKFNSPKEDLCMFMKLYNGTIDTELNNDFILPDYLADIKRIIRVGAKPKLDGKYISGSKIEYEGIVAYNILFLTEENLIKNVVFSTDFDNNIEIKNLSDDCVINVEPLIDTINCRLLNPRKINIKTKLKTNVEAMCKRCITPRVNGKISIEDEINLERDLHEISALNILHGEENDIKVSEDTEIDSSMPPIKDIIYCEPDIYIYEAKAMLGKVMFKGDAIISCIYSSMGDQTTSGNVSEKYSTFTKKIPISQVIDIDGINENYECMAKGYPGILKANVQANNYGENRLIELDFSYNIAMDCMCNEIMNMTRDMYSTEYEAQNEYTDINASKLYKNYNINFSVNEGVPRNEAGIENVINIIDMAANAHINTVKLDKNKLILEGIADVIAILETNADNDIINSNFSVPIKCELDSNNLSGTFDYKCNTNVISIKGRLDNNNIYSDIEVAVNCMVFEMATERVIEVSNINKDKKVSNDNLPPITLYYPQSGENLWDIAKHYKTTRNSIITANNLPDTSITNAKVLIVPRSKKRPSYSKII